jgi:hypothetical protein
VGTSLFDPAHSTAKSSIEAEHFPPPAMLCREEACPELFVMRPASRQGISDIFAAHTSIVEPPSPDEA